MIQIIDGQQRFRCDVCGKLVGKKKTPLFLNDAIKSRRVCCCTPACADIYWSTNYQLPLFEQGVPFAKRGVTTEGEG